MICLTFAHNDVKNFCMFHQNFIASRCRENSLMSNSKGHFDYLGLGIEFPAATTEYHIFNHNDLCSVDSHLPDPCPSFPSFILFRLW